MRANSINSDIGCLSVITFAENIFKKKDLSGYRLNLKHPQYITHTLKFKIKPLKINLLGPLFLSEKHKNDKPEEFAKCVLLFFKPWLKTPCNLKTHMSWSESLNDWNFEDRHTSDNRWYLKISKEGITASHPYIENINEMFEGKDRAKRQRIQLLNEYNKDCNLNDLEHGFSNKDDINDSNDNRDILPLFINNKKIIYLPNHNIRKQKITDHIQMVTFDILETFRPSIKNSERLLPKEIHFKKETLDIIFNSWKNNEICVDNMKINEDKSSIIPEEHPFRHMLFDYIPKEDKKNWNVEYGKKKEINKKFVEFLFTEYSKNQETRLVEFIVASNASAKQALVSMLLEEAHSQKLVNPETKGNLIGIFGKPGTGKSHAFTRIFEPYLRSINESKTLKKGAFMGFAALNIESFT